MSIFMEDMPNLRLFNPCKRYKNENSKEKHTPKLQPAIIIYNRTMSNTIKMIYELA